MTHIPSLNSLHSRFNLTLPATHPTMPWRGGAQAAVLIPLVNRPEPTLLLTQRALHLRHHPGQIAFPGGRAEAQDRSPICTALREAQEETGLPPANAKIWGCLPALSTVSGYQVTPVVALIEPPFTLSADHNEVAGIFEIPLAALMNPHHYQALRFWRKHKLHTVYAISVQKKFIWGATAAIMRNLMLQIA